jgi:hypothetical protein
MRQNFDSFLWHWKWSSAPLPTIWCNSSWFPTWFNSVCDATTFTSRRISGNFGGGPRFDGLCAAFASISLMKRRVKSCST